MRRCDADGRGVERRCGHRAAAVNVPGTGNTHNLVVTALGSRLLIDAGNGCEPGNSLLWYNPGRHAEQWLLKAPANAYGVLAVVPHYSSEDAPAL
jgi:hypothetical protein